MAPDFLVYKEGDGMELARLEPEFAVCKIPDLSGVDFSRAFVFLSKTEEEISLVCEACRAPDNATALEAGWKALKIAEALAFTEVGVLAKISNLLALGNISIFVISTYNTDYIFVKSSDLEKSVLTLRNNGYEIENLP